MSDLLNDMDIMPIQENHFGFVLKTYTQALHKVEPYNFIPNEPFFKMQTQVLNNYLKSGIQILVATIKDSPDDIMGYMIGDIRIPGFCILHWIHTKAIFRRMGVAHELLNAFDVSNRDLVCTHYVKEFKTYRETHKITYNPYIGVL